MDTVTSDPGRHLLSTPRVCQTSLVLTARGLKTITVAKLFGSLTHRIRMSTSGPTVLTGGNGTGKSTILRLIDAVSRGDIEALVRSPVGGLKLEFHSIPAFRLTRAVKDPSKAKISWGEHTATVSSAVDLSQFPEWATGVLATELGGAPRDDDEVRDELMESAQAAGVSYEEYRQAAELWTRLRKVAVEAADGTPPWLGELQSHFPVLFVTDQRLVVEGRTARRTATRPAVRRETSRRPSRLAVEAAGADIARQMRSADSAYARVSQNQDRRLRRDVIDAMTGTSHVSHAELLSLLADVDDRRESLRSVGLLDLDEDLGAEPPAEAFDREYVRDVVAAISRSTQEKLNVLEGLSDSLRSFKSFLDERFAPKRLVLTRGSGVTFALPNGITINPGNLSSGEQQMMILAYEIVFKSRPNTLVIIDEPELSLHVTWQDSLIETLSAMGRQNELQFLMASHSPMLLAMHPELERSLDR